MWPTTLAANIADYHGYHTCEIRLTWISSLQAYMYAMIELSDDPEYGNTQVADGFVKSNGDLLDYLEKRSH
jgi:hypothetical protein